MKFVHELDVYNFIFALSPNPGKVWKVTSFSPENKVTTAQDGASSVNKSLYRFFVHSS